MASVQVRLKIPSFYLKKEIVYLVSFLSRESPCACAYARDPYPSHPFPSSPSYVSCAPCPFYAFYEMTEKRHDAKIKNELGMDYYIPYPSCVFFSSPSWV